MIGRTTRRIRVAAATLLPLENERFAPVGRAPGHARSGRGDRTAVTRLRGDGIPLREGWFFREGDTDDAVIISESAARLLGLASPIGRRIGRQPGDLVRVVALQAMSPAGSTGPLHCVYRLIPLWLANIQTGGQDRCP
jgi:hypothetical protein